MLNLDTHMLVFALNGQLTADEHELLSGDQWSISAIVLWELAKLVQLGRLELDLDAPEVVRALGTLTVWPIDLAVCRLSTRLDFASDPADELIVATSILHNVPLVTRDARIRSSALVPLA